MKQFNLDEYLKNPERKIVTYDGREVRIICVNRIDKDYPVVALVRKKNVESIESYTKDGKYINNKIYNHDLFFAPEKKEGWINVYRGCGEYNTYVCNTIFATKEEAKREKRDIIATIKIEWEEDNGQD